MLPVPCCPEPYGCGQASLTDISPSGFPSAAREGSPCLVTLPHPVGGHRSWSQRSTLYMEALESCSPEKVRASSLPLGSHTPSQVLHGMWLCPPHLVWFQTQEHIRQPTLYTHPKPPPMLSSVPEDTFGGLQAATSPLPNSLALRQNPCFAPLPWALAECFPNPADSWPA